MIHILNENATSQQINEMLEVYPSMIKIVVDIRRKILVGGGVMHVDCEALLLSSGSEQDDLWGADWFPEDQRIEYEALINIRPRLVPNQLILCILCKNYPG